MWFTEREDKSRTLSFLSFLAWSPRCECVGALGMDELSQGDCSGPGLLPGEQSFKEATAGGASIEDKAQ